VGAEIQSERESAWREVETAADEPALEAVRVKYLGRQGRIRQLLSGLSTLPAEDRGETGRLINEFKVELDRRLQQRLADVRSARPVEKPPDLFDITLPGQAPSRGTLHPVTQAANELIGIFSRLGFEVVYGPEIESEFHNFEALNIPPDHPSRDGFTTFYLDDRWLLRSHTSPVQIRTMQERQPPLRVVAPGRVFRPDTVDASHYPVFHQIEGLVVGEGISFLDLKAVLSIAMRELFGAGTRTRFRPSFFPFTEPSAEVDVSCPFCRGAGCSVCSRKGWIELLGAGMVDPTVFEAVGYDPEKYTGFAFGMGIDRIAMMKYGIQDIRLLFENDLRLLEQF